MENKTIYEKEFLDWFVGDATIDEVRTEILVILKRENNTGCIQEILERFKEELKALEDLSLEDNSREEMEFLKDVKDNITSKASIIKEIIETDKNEQERNDYLDKTGINNGVLFATNDYGNIIIEKHLKKLKKDCSSDVYKSFLTLIEELVLSKENFDPRKQKPLSNNSLLKDIYEKKEKQARVYYQYAKGHIVIIGATIKKNDNNTEDRAFVANVKEKSNGYIEDLKSGKANVEELTKESNEFYQKIAPVQNKSEGRK